MSKFNEYLEMVKEERNSSPNTGMEANAGYTVISSNDQDSILNTIIGSAKSYFIIPFIKKELITPDNKNEILKDITEEENDKLLKLMGFLKQGLKPEGITITNYDFPPFKENGIRYVALKIDIKRNTTTKK